MMDDYFFDEYLDNYDRLDELQERVERTQREFEKLGLVEIANDKEKLDSFLKNLSYGDAKKWLVYLNSKVRDISRKVGGVYERDVYVRELVSPENDIQESCLKKGFEVIKKLDNPQARASLAYYLLLDLHLFEDGNGRTSRLIYDILSENKFDFVSNYEWYLHDEENFSIKRGDFDDLNYLFMIQEINNLTGYYLFKELIKEGKIIDDPRVGSKSIRTFRQGFYGGKYEGVYIDDEIKNQLTEEEIYRINRSILDNNTSYTVGGMAMAVMMSKKGKMDKCIEINENCIQDLEDEEAKNIRQGRFTFYVGDDEEVNSVAKMMFGDFKKEDYLEMVDIANEIKERQFDVLFDLYVQPEKYVDNYRGKTIAGMLVDGATLAIEARNNSKLRGK